MGSIWVREFSGGLDLRKLPETTPGGALIRAIDCHINRGGEIEQRADFVLHATLPEGTKGFAAKPDGLVVFGHQGSAPAGMPSDIAYQQLAHPGGEALADVPYWHRYKGAVQAVGEYVDGSRHVFDDGTRISDAQAPPNLSGSSPPDILLTNAQKLFVAAGPDLFFSAVGDNTDFGAGAGTGQGFISMSTHAEGATKLTGLALYDEYVAVFSRRVVQIWVFDPDPALSTQAQVLNNTGNLAPRALTQFGDGDLFYLSRSGIRSLRARDSSNSAATTDIGSPIDDLVTELLDALSTDQVTSAIGAIEPRTGRFWMAIGERILVFSFFSQSNVSSWSEYRPGFTVEHMFEWDDRIWIRSGDSIYSYGGTGAAPQFSSDVEAEVWLPYLDGDDPTRAKTLTGIDAAVRGTWEVRVGMDPNVPDASDKIATITRTTYNVDRIDAVGEGTHFSPRFTCKAPESATKPGRLSAAVLHYESDAEEDS